MITDPVRPRGLRAAGLAGSLCFLLVTLVPGTAAAHGAEALTDNDYRVTITGRPDLDGVTARVVEAGSRLELRNDGPDNVEVLGYQREPYAELRPDGLYINTNSPAAYLNETADGSSPVPANASAAAIPLWTKASDVPVLRWHDHRAGWMSELPPPQAGGDTDVRVLDWRIPLRVGTTTHQLTGSVYWVAAPQTPSWLAGALLAAATVAAIGIAGTARRYAAPVLAAASALAGTTMVVDAIGRSMVAADAQYHWAQVLILGQLWQLVAGLCGIAAAGYALARRPAADLALGLAGLFMALLTVLTRWGSLVHPLTPTPWPGDWARAGTVTVLAVGTGLAVAAGWQARHRNTGIPDAPTETGEDRTDRPK